MKIKLLILLSLFMFALSGCDKDIQDIVQSDVQEVIIVDEVEIVPETTPLTETVPSTEIPIAVDSTEVSESSFGAVSALSETTFTLEEMLVYAIQDEYAARAEYEYILDNFDVTRPFSNIIKAEVTHIGMLVPLFETFDLAIPEDTSADHLIVVTDLTKTFETGVLAEELNIAMYNLFLEQDDLPVSVADTFTRLRDASLSHLAAFQKQLDRR